MKKPRVLTINSIPKVGETVTVDGVVYFFQNDGRFVSEATGAVLPLTSTQNGPIEARVLAEKVSETLSDARSSWNMEPDHVVSTPPLKDPSEAVEYMIGKILRDLEGLTVDKLSRMLHTLVEIVRSEK